MGKHASLCRKFKLILDQSLAAENVAAKDPSFTSNMQDLTHVLLFRSVWMITQTINYVSCMQH